MPDLERRAHSIERTIFPPEHEPLRKAAVSLLAAAQELKRLQAGDTTPHLDAIYTQSIADGHNTLARAAREAPAIRDHPTYAALQGIKRELIAQFKALK